MKLNDSALATTSSQRIESKMGGVWLVITTTANDWAAAVTAMAATKISIERQSAVTGLKQLVLDRKLTEYLEFCSQRDHEDFIVSAAASSAAVIRAKINFSDRGTIDFRASEYLKINFSALPASYTVDLYSLDGPVTAAAVNKNNQFIGFVHNLVDTKSVLATTPSTVPLNGVNALGLPTTTTRIELHYRNGKMVQYLPEEIKAICYENKPVLMNQLGVITSGFIGMYVLPVYDCVKAVITTSADATVWLQSEIIL